MAKQITTVQGKHTPGKWKTMNWGKSISVTAPGKETPVAYVNPNGDDKKGIPTEEDAANAALIAAAPELLDALDALLDWCRTSTPEYPAIMLRAEEVIRKATAAN